MDHLPTVLICGFHEAEQVSLISCLEQHYRVFCADFPEEIKAIIDTETVDLVLCMHNRDNLDAIPFLKSLRISHPGVIRILGGDLSQAEMVAAINEAAIYQFFTAPWFPEEMELLVRRAIETRELAFRHRHLNRELKIAEDVLEKHNKFFEHQVDETSRFDKLVYCSPNMAEVCNAARKASKTSLPVLIQGETGTGKELLARAIHYNSDRKEQPLMIQNCGGLSDELLLSELFGHKRGAFTGAVSDRLGLFPAADGGTVFLDEISEVSPAFQVALLRFLQEGEVKPVGSDKTITCNVRVIAACNRPLIDMVKNNEFRRDLYYRLNGFPITIPPLRERIDDIPLLAEFLAYRYGDSISRRILGISPEVNEKFKAYHWPGNVRELDNEVKRMVALADNGEYLSMANLAPHLRDLVAPKSTCTTCAELKGDTLKEKVEYLEAQLVQDALLKHRWNQSRAAAELGISRVGLANKIKRYALISDTSAA